MLSFLKKFHFKFYNKASFVKKIRASDTGGRGDYGTPRFYIAKRKKENKEKKERFSKQKLLKGCHQGQSVAVLAILERLLFKKNFLSVNYGGQKYFSVFHGPSPFKSISPALKIAGKKFHFKFITKFHL